MSCDAKNANADRLGCRVLQIMRVPMVWDAVGRRECWCLWFGMPCDAENAGAYGLGCRVMQRMLVPMVWDAV